MSLSRKILVFSMIILIIYTIPPVHGTTDIEIMKLMGVVYPDGSTKIEYDLELDPLAARVNMTLLGNTFDDLTVIDSDGLLLDHSINSGVITIDSLGSYRVKVSYFTPSLTNKTSSLWTLVVDTPSKMDFKLPIGATIVGLNTVPESISITNNQVSLSMLRGTFTVTYVVSVAGIQNEAQTQIEIAQEALNHAKNKGIMISEGETLLDKALTSFTIGNFIEAKTYAVQSKSSVEEITTLAAIAESEINEAVEKLEGVNKNSDIYSETNDLIQTAQDNYGSGNYTGAYTYAQQAVMTIDNHVQPTSWYQYVIVLSLLPIIGYSVWKFYPRMLTSDTVIERYDIEALFEENPHLRSDEKEVLEFIAEHVGGLFITVVREKFDLAKSTAWRMIQRFEAAELIETKSIGRETFLKINSIWAYED
jgi:uncharacterized membrane protein